MQHIAYRFFVVVRFDSEMQRQTIRVDYRLSDWLTCSCHLFQVVEQTRALVAEQHQKGLYDMSNTKASNNSTKILEQTRDQQLAHVFFNLGGDLSSHISRNNGRMLINLGCPIISSIIAKLLRTHFRSSVQKLTYEVFKRLCVEEFKTPLTDGFSAWYRLNKLSQTQLTLADAQASCGVEISFDVSEDERGGQEDEQTERSQSQSSMLAVATLGPATKKRHQKKKDGPSVYARLCEKNTERERLLDEMRRQQLQTEIEECFFYPQTSRKAAPSPRRQPANFYDRLLEKEKQKERFLEEARRKKATDAMKECTFRPILNKTRSPASNKNSVHPSRLGVSDYLSSTLDLGCSFIADATVSLSLFSPATFAVSSPLAVELPAEHFSYRDLQCAGRGEANAADSETLNRFMKGGGGRQRL